MRMLALALLLFALHAPPARADAYLEPDVGEEFGKISQTLTPPSAAALSTSTNQSGFCLGLKGGLTVNLFYGGLVYEQAFGAQVTDLGAFAGLLVEKFQAWGAFFFKSKDSVSKGRGFELGLGVPIYRVALNAAFASRAYTTYTAPTLAGSSFSGKRNTAALTLSVPLML